MYLSSQFLFHNQYKSLFWVSHTGSMILLNDMVIITIPITITIILIIASTTDSHLPFTCGRGRSRLSTAPSADPPASWIDDCCHTWTWAWWPRPGLSPAGWPMLQVLVWGSTHTFPLDISVSLLRCGVFAYNIEQNIYVFFSPYAGMLLWRDTPLFHWHFPFVTCLCLMLIWPNFSWCFFSDSHQFTYSLHAKLHKRCPWQRCHPELLPPYYCATPQATISSFNVFKPFLFRHASVLW